jgi:hypothetical protein
MPERALIRRRGAVHVSSFNAAESRAAWSGNRAGAGLNRLVNRAVAPGAWWCTGGAPLWRWMRHRDLPAQRCCLRLPRSAANHALQQRGASLKRNRAGRGLQRSGASRVFRLCAAQLSAWRRMGISDGRLRVAVKARAHACCRIPCIAIRYLSSARCTDARRRLRRVCVGEPSCGARSCCARRFMTRHGLRDDVVVAARVRGTTAAT